MTHMNKLSQSDTKERTADACGKAVAGDANAAAAETRAAAAGPFALPELSALLDWYDKNRRILPWREDPTPYHVWVSEIMLQQTRVEAVIPYYERFLAALPDVPALAAAPEELLLKLWEGLGYYSRVRNLQKAAVQLTEQYGGVLPREPKALEKLAGIGPYTAAAIASVAYQVKAPAVDGNLLRVYARLTGDPRDVGTPAAKKAAASAYAAVFPDDRPGDLNQALMDLGATVCLPNGAPHCGRCPLADRCAARRDGLTDVLPVLAKKAPRRVEHRTVFIILQGDRVLLRKRPKTGLLAGLWEFPNTEGCLSETQARAFCAALGIAQPDLALAPPARHVFTHLEWDMTAWLVTVPLGHGDGSSVPLLRHGDGSPVSLSLPDPAPLRESPAADGPDSARFIPVRTVLSDYALPSAFSAYTRLLSAILTPQD